MLSIRLSEPILYFPWVLAAVQHCSNSNDFLVNPIVYRQTEIFSREAVDSQNATDECLRRDTMSRHPNTGNQGNSHQGLIFASHKSEILETGLPPHRQGSEFSLGLLSYSGFGLSPVWKLGTAFPDPLLPFNQNIAMPGRRWDILRLSLKVVPNSLNGTEFKG